jgi:hypothetical protein
VRTPRSYRVQCRAHRRISLSFRQFGPHSCKCLAENENRILELGPEFIVTRKVDTDFAHTSVRIAYNLSEVATTFRPQCGSTVGSWCVPPRHSPASPFFMCSLNAAAVTVSAGPDMSEDGASVSVTATLSRKLSSARPCSRTALPLVTRKHTWTRARNWR